MSTETMAAHHLRPMPFSFRDSRHPEAGPDSCSSESMSARLFGGPLGNGDGGYSLSDGEEGHILITFLKVIQLILSYFLPHHAVR